MRYITTSNSLIDSNHHMPNLNNYAGSGIEYILNSVTQFLIDNKYIISCEKIALFSLAIYGLSATLRIFVIG